MVKLKKVLVPSFIRTALDLRRNRHEMRNSWIDRTGEKFLNIYWDSVDNPNRPQLVELIADCIGSANEASILEYGSHVGVNFRLIAERFPDNKMRYFAVEPNHEAFEFMIDKLPFIEGLEAEDTAFVAATDYPPCPVTLSFTSGVMVVMEEQPAYSVLAKMAAISNVIILGEAFDNLEGRKSEYNLGPAYHKHPYRMWLRDLGFEITQVETAVDPQPQFTGYLVANRAAN